MDHHPLVELRNVSKDFGSNGFVVDAINLSVERGEVLCLLGPSGSGKTTLLKMIAGLSEPTSGEILIDGKDMGRVPARNRDIGFVFQSAEAVFPHLTVAQNIDFPLSLKKRRRDGRDRTLSVSEKLTLVDMQARADSYPETLSGGELQRVAIARALVYEPLLLLLDEPLSSLDNILKREVIDSIFRIKASHADQTIVYVTHSEREAFELADRIAVLENGKILQVGTPKSIFENPETRKVAEIIGGWNIGRCIGTAVGPKVEIRFAGQSIELDGRMIILQSQRETELSLGYPVSATVLSSTKPQLPPDGFLFYEGEVMRVWQVHGRKAVKVHFGNLEWTAEIDLHKQWVEPGIRVCLGIDSTLIRVWR